jgi:GDP-L-fucose synthase
MKEYSGDIHVNVGSGEEFPIADLARAVARAVGFEGEIVFDSSKPDGAARKLVDTTRLARLGWTARTSLPEGLRQTYEWYLEKNG